MTSRPLKDPGGVGHVQGPLGINAEGYRNHLRQKIDFGSLRDLIDPWRFWEAIHSQGPSGIKAEVKRNHLRQKNDLGSLKVTLEVTGGSGYHKGPSGIDAEVKRNCLNQKRPQLTFAGLWRVPEAKI